MKKKVIVITGPTGVGKTKISIDVAKRLNTEIINGDAFQIYKYMNIGTAKPSSQELSQIKHHFFDVIDPLTPFSVSDYQKEIRKIIDDFHSQNKIPLIVGGTGLYIDSVLRNYQFLAPKRNSNEEAKYDNLSNEELYELLKIYDFDASLKIHMNNRKRVLRAIELANTQEIKTRTLKNEFLYDSLIIFLNDDRKALYERINNRVDKMINKGLIEEVKSFYPNKLGPTAVKAIGYKELYEYFDGKVSLDVAIENIKKNTRHYAKRQFTWYRNKKNTIFVNVNINNLSLTIDEVTSIINNFLKK